MLIITELLIAARSAKSTNKISLINPSIGIVLTSFSALLTSIAILITSEFTSILKIKYTKLRDCVNVITRLYEKTMKKFMIDKFFDEKESEELKKV